MSTRGFVGFVRNGATLATWCPFDSYPDGLGVQTAAFAAANLAQIDVVADEFLALERGGQDEDVNVDVDREGELDAYFEAGRVPVLFEVPLEDAVATLPTDLEWGYLINVDTHQFEAHKLPGRSGLPVATFTIPLDELSAADDLAERIEEELSADDDAREAGEAAYVQRIVKERYGLDMPPM